MILLFDGVCNLCNTSVQWIIEHDSRATIRFAAQQSESGQALLAQYNLVANDINSLVLIAHNRAYIGSEAALRTAAALDAPWCYLNWLRIFPLFVRDPVYRLVAHNRYRWFGKKDACMLPSESLKNRFL